MSVIIYSVNLGKYDVFRDIPPAPGARNYYITDTMYPHSNWEYVPVEETGDLKRRAGYYKINSHLLFPQHTVSCYIDASLKLLQPLGELIQRFMESDADIAIPFHPNRECTYEEAKACKKRQLDDPACINEQMERYRAEGFPEQWGMVATPLILRKNTPQVREFNQVWWEQIHTGSRRDQLSVMYAQWKTGVYIDKLSFSIYKNNYFKKCKHANQ